PPPAQPPISLPQQSDPTTFVNAFIGTTNGGHVFPGTCNGVIEFEGLWLCSYFMLDYLWLDDVGATIPHGMIKVGMDTDSPGNHAGYDGDPQFNVTGFSQLHDSGTGGAVPLSNFKIFPFPTCSSFETCPVTMVNRKVLRKVLDNGLPDDAASPGYFASNLTNNVRVELTSTRRTALHRYTFPAGTANPRILVDITNDGQKSSTNAEGTIDPVTARVKGGAEFAASFGPAQGYELGKPTEYGVWLGNFPVRGTTDLLQVYYGFVSEMGALLTFAPSPQFQTTPTTLLVRIGVSFISSSQACANAESEIPDFDFERVRAESRGSWGELLGRVQVDVGGGGGLEEMRELFYSSWDTYRTLYPLMSMHDPITFSRIVRGMIDIQRHEGWLPECRGATAQHFIQGGSNGDPILGEFYVKFANQAKSLGVSATDLYNALLADAEIQPPNWNLQGRQANLWKQLGYIPQDMFDAGGANTKQVSRTVELAFDDFAISQVAKMLGKTADKQKYLKRSGNFANVWNPNVTVPDATNIVGMMQPRFADGTFNSTDPRHCSIHDPTQATCFLNAARRDGFYEGSPIIYSQYAPHDNAKLIQLQGGVESFIQRLDFIFANEYFESTDEPSQQMPFMYHYANRPGFSTQRSRQVIAEFFNTSRNGLPGNDDSGAMGSYAAFYLLGMYPLPATQQILISSPYFPKISFFNPLFNTTTTIVSKGFKGNPTDGTGGTVFVKGVTIDGKPWHSNCFIDWDVFVKGSTVELTLTDDINVPCGKDASALPPSVSTGGYD
ncbi:hypothetical protein CVT24_010275, partial [Panaeolus cyanescens]